MFWGVAFPLVLTVVFGLAGDKHGKALGGPEALLGADFTVAAGLIALAMALVVIVAKLAFSVRLQVLGWLVTLTLSGAALLALGALIASIAGSAGSRLPSERCCSFR